MSTETYEDVNRARWDERAPAHARAPDYWVNELTGDPSALSPVTKFDIPLLGSIEGLKVIHLQCHIGTDTLSLARRGAKSVVGLDFSPASLMEGRELCSKAAGGEKVSFVEASVYDAVEAVQGTKFDLVFTGIGALCWIPDITRWAQVVCSLLKPGGRLFIREGHPMLWSIDEKIQDQLVVGYPYFETAEPMVYHDDSTYADAESRLTFKSTKSIVWNHGLGEIIQALLDSGMRITGLKEHDSIPWDAIPGQMELISENEHALKVDRARLPLTYTLQAVKD